MFVLINREFVNEAEASIPLSNRGLLFGDGVFTTILATNGQLNFWPQHCDRLIQSAKLFRMPFDPDELFDAVHGLLEANYLTDGLARVRVTLTRLPATDQPKTLHVTGQEQLFELVTAALYKKPSEPASLMISSFLWESSLAHTKHIGYQTAQLALLEAQDAGFNDALLLNSNGHVVCATTANIFLLIDGQWRTPPISDGILPGIMRGAVLASGVATELSITVADISRAAAGFLTNSLIGIRPIARIQDVYLDTSLCIAVNDPTKIADHL